jgi:hypothetical protein
MTLRGAYEHTNNNTNNTNNSSSSTRSSIHNRSKSNTYCKTGGVLGELMRAVAGGQNKGDGSSSSSSSASKASSSGCGSIDGKSFAKLIKGAPGVLSAQLSAADADLIFVKVRVSCCVRISITSSFLLPT